MDLPTYAGRDDDQIHLIAGEMKSKHWRRKIGTWAGLVEVMHDVGRSKEGAGAYVPVALKKTTARRGCWVNGAYVDKHDGYHRVIEGVVFASLVTLDADKAGPDFIERLQRLGYAGLVHPTFTHDPEIGLYKYRALLRVNRAMLPEEKFLVTRAIMRSIGWNIFDPTCASPEHYMFWPARPLGADDFELTVLDGRLIDVDDIVWLAELEDDKSPLRRKKRSIHDGYEAEATEEEREDAQHELHWRADRLSGLGDGERTPFLAGALPAMYRYVLGGCLTRVEVDAAMSEAYMASGHDIDKYESQMDSLWDMAEAWGPDRPETAEDVSDVFGVVEDQKVSERTTERGEMQQIVRLRKWFRKNPTPGALRWCARKAKTMSFDHRIVSGALLDDAIQSGMDREKAVKVLEQIYG